MKKMLKIASVVLFLLVSLFHHSELVSAGYTRPDGVYVSDGGSEYDLATFPSQLTVGDKGQVRRPSDSPFKDTVYSFDAIVDDPSIISFDEKGNWIALKPGKTKVSFVFPSGDSPQFRKFEDEVRKYGIRYEVKEVAIFVEVTVSGTDIGAGLPVYRLYNPNNHEHLYTLSEYERDTLVRIGWGNYEGISFQSSASGNRIYRLFHPILKDHHYTSDLNEISVLTSQHGWKDEGVQWFAGGEKPVYRLFHPGLTSGSHHYTLDQNEVSVLKSRGWVYEGIAWYSR